jgi:hypothetical protein
MGWLMGTRLTTELGSEGRDCDRECDVVAFSSGRWPKGENYETNPILSKPAWKRVGNKAKNEPNCVWGNG